MGLGLLLVLDRVEVADWERFKSAIPGKIDSAEILVFSEKGREIDRGGKGGKCTKESRGGQFPKEVSINDRVGCWEEISRAWVSSCGGFTGSGKGACVFTLGNICTKSNAWESQRSICVRLIFLLYLRYMTLLDKFSAALRSVADATYDRSVV